ncbi:uncharacterized protein LOC121690144 [Alosa sapidissima]|uniref:uncharacterized protein LOC121690144 n=1 Tax=Alosa sapidissima TaxID=34773 RepID=UPI001C0A1DE5|nr:uncharacterized protein LOC121690144 [Alosa sapidissima]XP_041926492.1 uncharacterized protein LOC121690144 [Alosa sapidissima]XP_041926493.1 uncharacterized protein LOC121690144 [Alosa sapidissima]XP_041926494.1 uncharacterized protein LOC121690144 [Alosa sapidissima]
MSKQTDLNGEAVEEMINDQMLVCLNNGYGTRLNIYKNEMSCIDLTLVDKNIASRCEWTVDESTSIGSDHFPITCQIDIGFKIEQGYIPHRWVFKKADWEKYVELCKEIGSLSIDNEQSIDEINGIVSSSILLAASQSIPISQSFKKQINVPWWNDKCSEAIKDRNRAFKLLGRTLTMDNLISYQRKKAIARKVIKEAKRESWRQFCSSIGKETSLNQVWMMIRKMVGKYKPPHIPVLMKDGINAISDIDKANMLNKAFADIHKGSHLEERFKKRKEEVLKANKNVLNQKEQNMSIMDADFSMSELKRALNNTAYSAPGSDNLCYVMFRKLPDNVLENILSLFNKVWNEGNLPTIWKGATILPFPKPGKDATSPGNYRPIALTSHLGKLMGKTHSSEIKLFLRIYQPSKGISNRI